MTDNELDRLRKLIDEFDSVLVLRRKVDYLEAKEEDLKIKAKNLMQLVEMANFSAQYYEFTGTIQEIQQRGSQLIIILYDGPKKVRFILGDNRWPDIHKGQVVTIQADVTPITISMTHAQDGFVKNPSNLSP